LLLAVAITYHQAHTDRQTDFHRAPVFFSKTTLSVSIATFLSTLFAQLRDALWCFATTIALRAQQCVPTASNLRTPTSVNVNFGGFTVIDTTAKSVLLLLLLCQLFCFISTSLAT
jgi:hypothetical protein